MSFFSSPTSFRLNNLGSALHSQHHVPPLYATVPGNGSMAAVALSDSGGGGAGGGPADHPSLLHLMLLVFEAVMEVVCVSLPGYIIARYGLFNTENQKFVANLNVSLFTPCLIFTKLASQLTLSKIAELGIIPVLFAFMTVVSYFCALAVSRVFGFEKRARNFVIAMGVFGNSNSLPISLVLSLANTISGLHWDRIPGDNDAEVAARGILYLLIFQQLGQLLRWSWGYHVLLAPPSPPPSPPLHHRDRHHYRDQLSDQSDGDGDGGHLDRVLVDPLLLENSLEGLHGPATENQPLLFDAKRNHHYRSHTAGTYDSAIGSGGRTPVSSGYPSSASLHQHHPPPSTQPSSFAGSTTQLPIAYGPSPSLSSPPLSPSPSPSPPPSELPAARPCWAVPKRAWSSSSLPLPSSSSSSPSRLSSGVSRVVGAVVGGAAGFARGLWAFMNPPLWAMLAAVVVASVPSLQRLFFTEGTFVNASFTRAVSQSGGVAVPLILVVLGANLANSSSSAEATKNDRHASKLETRILAASLVSRMVLPFVFTAPVLAVLAKYLNVAILDDPIFLIVCFLLAGAPSALQLAQICQINSVYEDVITRVLFWSYVVVILPSTLVLVISAIEVVHWAT